jgi:hypothetical protein
METITFDKDIKVFYITATSFPEKLHALIPFTIDRRYFGVSRPENGGQIIYRAAAEELETGEGEKLKLETLILKKGKYISLIIPDFVNDIPAIEKTFNLLTSQPDIDPQGYCVEEYIDQKDMICMVKLADK